MEALSIQKAMQHGEGRVKIRGWVYRERGSNKFRFIIIRDSTNIIQCIFEKEVFQEEFEELKSVQLETSIEVQGIIKKDDRAPSGYEIQAEKFEIIGSSDNFPIQKDQSQELLNDNRHLWLRSRKMTSILKIRSTIFGAIHEYFRNQEFYEFHSPILQSTQSEGGSEVFEVKYFDTKLYLAQTWQLPAEAGIFALEKIYTIAPSFRAEKSKTSRHLTEYWHAEMEMAWSNFDDIIDHGESLLKHVLKKVLEQNKEELKLLERDTEELEISANRPFTRMTYTEALKILKEKCNLDVEWGKDLRTIEEDELSKLYKTPIVVSHYPKKVKAFYMKEAENDTVLGCDFIAPSGYGEIIGGSQREENIDQIKLRLKEQGENPDDYDFYLDTRRYGSVPHGGFGMGVERIIAWICGLDHIRDAIPFPRTMLRYHP
ncbi:MAG: asparagine--tRNA ligase [Candidatus Woesearchaeota archaeon]